MKFLNAIMLGLLGGVGMTGILALSSLAVWGAWNYVMPILGLAKITYLGAICLVVLSYVFTGRVWGTAGCPDKKKSNCNDKKPIPPQGG